MTHNKKRDGWLFVSILLLAMFILVLVYPMFGLLKQSVVMADGRFSLEEFQKIFSASYYMKAITNSFSVSFAIVIVTLIFGIPFAYFYAFYELKGSLLLFVVSLLCCMSAPFLGAYSWIMLLGRRGVITRFLAQFGIRIASIYGFNGIVFVQFLKFFPLVFIYMNGAFKNIDNTLMEASANLGCTGIKRFFKVVLHLSMPTILAAALMVFMRAFADFGTPMLIGEGYTTFPVLIYNTYLGENGTDYNLAAAISVVAVVITALVFFVQKWATSRFNFAINALHPVQKKKPKGLSGALIYLYTYGLCFVAFLPQIYIIYLSFCNYRGSVRNAGYSLANYTDAMRKLLVRSIRNTVFLGVAALVIIVIVAVLIAYLVVRRTSVLNNTIDTLSMLPYIMPGSVVGIALLIAFGREPFAIAGTLLIMTIAVVIRRMPYTIRSATATLMQIPISIEEAAISLGASKAKTFIKVTVPMMSNGILSGAILSWVAIVTELSSAIILYNNRTITLTMSAYVQISRGNYGTAAAFAAILTVITVISLIAYLFATRGSEDVQI